MFGQTAHNSNIFQTHFAKICRQVQLDVPVASCGSSHGNPDRSNSSNHLVVDQSSQRLQRFSKLMESSADRMGPWGFGDAVVLLSPIGFLVAMVLKPNPMPTSKSLWLAAVLLFVLKLWYLQASPLEACACFVKGVLQALTPCSIVAGAIFLFDCMESSQCLAWMKVQLRVVTDSHPVAEVMLIGFCFAFVVEGASGFGTPAALAAPMLHSMGHPKMECVVCLLTFNTFMTIFGAVGTPVWFGIGEVVLDYGGENLMQVGVSALLRHHFGSCFKSFFCILRVFQ